MAILHARMCMCVWYVRTQRLMLSHQCTTPCLCDFTCAVCVLHVGGYVECVCVCVTVCACVVCVCAICVCIVCVCQCACHVRVHYLCVRMCPRSFRGFPASCHRACTHAHTRIWAAHCQVLEKFRSWAARGRRQLPESGHLRRAHDERHGRLPGLEPLSQTAAGRCEGQGRQGS